MNTQEIFNYLDEDANIESQRQRLHSYLRLQIENYKDNPENGRAIAYNIAGLLGSKYASSLPENDPYLQILILAGKLELPAEFRDAVSNWNELIKMIEDLD